MARSNCYVTQLFYESGLPQHIHIYLSPTSTYFTYRNKGAWLLNVPHQAVPFPNELVKEPFRSHRSGIMIIKHALLSKRRHHRSHQDEASLLPETASRNTTGIDVLPDPIGDIDPSALMNTLTPFCLFVFIIAVAARALSVRRSMQSAQSKPRSSNGAAAAAE